MSNYTPNPFITQLAHLPPLRVVTMLMLYVFNTFIMQIVTYRPLVNDMKSIP